MEKLTHYSQLISDKISALNLPENPTDLYEPMRYILSIGGKRLRPVMTLMSASLFEGKEEDALSQALAVELFHNFSLIHDDIMDEADLRRGNKTVHKKWDTPIAILSGDGMLIKAYQLLSDAPAEQLPDLLHCFSQTALEVCEGQIWDMDFEKRSNTIDEYLNMIRLKTAVLIGAALKIGAIRAGADKSDADLIYDTGVNWGLAFQIKDDYLDLYGNMEKVGKVTGGDILANKKTLLYLYCKEKASEEDQVEIDRLFQTEANYPNKVRSVQQLFDRYEVAAKSLQTAQAYFDKGSQKLQQIKADKTKQQSLMELGRYLLDREY